MAVALLVCCAGCQEEKKEAIQLEALLSNREPAVAVEFSHDGKLLAVGCAGLYDGGYYNEYLGETRIWHIEDIPHGEPTVIGRGCWVNALAFSADDNRLFLGYGRWRPAPTSAGFPVERIPGGGALAVWDVAKKQHTKKGSELFSSALNSSDPFFVSDWTKRV